MPGGKLVPVQLCKGLPRRSSPPWRATLPFDGVSARCRATVLILTAGGEDVRAEMQIRVNFVAATAQRRISIVIVDGIVGSALHLGK